MSPKYKIGDPIIITIGMIAYVGIIRSADIKSWLGKPVYLYSVDTCYKDGVQVFEDNLLPIELTRNIIGSMTDWKVDYEILEDEAIFLQTQKGYHPNGYSFHHFKREDGATTWQCYTAS